MRIRTTLALVLCAVLLVAFATSGQVDLGRLHPSLRAFLSAMPSSAHPASGSTPLGWSSDKIQWTIRPTGEPAIGILVLTEERIIGPRYGPVPVRGRAGHVVALAVTLSELTELASDPNVVYIEPSWRTRPTLDQSLPIIRADRAHAIDAPVLGTGVLIGIVDTGIDYEHLDFRYDGDGDGTEERTRIHAIWDQTWGLFGAKYSRSHIDADLALGLGPGGGSVRTMDQNGHGTHVAGIAAGDGSSSTAGFVGVAPDATLAVVKTSFFTADILRAVEWVFDEADALGLPAVVNLSLGGHEGPHDGTSLFERGLNQLLGQPGRAIVVSAGNEGDLTIHTSAELSGGSTVFEVVPEDWEIELSVWYPGSSAFAVSVGRPGQPALSAPPGTDTGFVSTPHGTLLIDNASEGPNPSNGDNEVFIRLANVTAGDSWLVEIDDVSGGGRFDAWVTTPRGIIENGDSEMTIDEPGNAHRVMTVGSYNSKSTWPSLSGQQDYASQYPVGRLSSFSSRGPTRDGRVKPEVSAPGAWIGAAGSSDAPQFGYLTHPDGVHVMEIGTSMAAPHVAGTIALLFERDPTRTADELKTVLTTTAQITPHTGSVPNMGWGWGLVDALSALDAVGGPDPPAPLPSPEVPSIVLDENPVSDTARFFFDAPEGTTRASLRVYSVAGELVFEASVSPSAGEYVWPLASNRDEMLAIGLYFYVLVTDRGTSEVGRLVILR